MVVQILQLSIAQPKEVDFNNKTISTSIFKSPVDGPLMAYFDHIDGDLQADLSVHGGRDKAIYVYSQAHYQFWQAELDRDKLEIAQFGENLTVSKGLEQEIVIGSRYRLGDAEVVVAQPRIPCFKLGIRVGDKNFPKVFWDSGLLGFYLRVEKEGILQRGDSFELMESPAHGITVHDLWAMLTQKNATIAETSLNQLQHLDSGWRKRLKQAI